MKKQRKKQEELTKKEELVEYKLADYVNKAFVWSMLVTLPSCDCLQKVHKVLHKKRPGDNQLEQDLKNINKEFFQILQLLYYYVTIGKDEQILVKYTLSTVVSVLTEAISKLAINGANHTDRPLHAYGKMLKLEKLIEEFNSSVVLQEDNQSDINIRAAIQAVSEYLEAQFIVLDRVLSVIYLKYLEYTTSITKTPDLISLNPKFAKIYEILTSFFGKMRELIDSYPEHNFARLLITTEDVDATLDKNVILLTPEKQVSRSVTGSSIQHTSAPDATPTGITDDVKKSAAFIAKVLNADDKDKTIIFKASEKKKDINDSLEEELSRDLCYRLHIPEEVDTSVVDTSVVRPKKFKSRKQLFDITNIV